MPGSKPGVQTHPLWERVGAILGLPSLQSLPTPNTTLGVQTSLSCYGENAGLKWVGGCLCVCLRVYADQRRVCVCVCMASVCVCVCADQRQGYVCVYP